MTNRRFALALVSVAITSLLRATAATAQAPRDPDRILELMEQQMRRSSLEYVGEVTVTSRRGTERRKDWVSFRQGSGRTANRLIRFLGPADVRGVAFLSLGHANGTSDQWMYLPSMKRERRLAPQDRDAAFVGTDFSYAELEEFERSDFAARLLTDDDVDGERCFSIELTPRLRSPYARQQIAVSQARLVPRRISYLRTGQDAPAKVMTFSDYRQVDGYWVAQRVEMADRGKGSHTTVRLTSVRVDRPQPADRYTVLNLVRENADLPAREDARPFLRGWQSGGTTAPATRHIPPGLTGTLVTGVNLFPSGHADSDARALGNARLDLRQQITLKRLRVAAGARAEAQNVGRLGHVQWDPFDRALRRSPLSLRELALSATLASGIDLTVGRFDVSWGSTDTHSPAAGFLSRDLTDPLAWESLPLWGARLTAELSHFRLDLYDAFTTTPWRLPRLDGRYSPGVRSDLFFDDPGGKVPTKGFGMARLTRLGNGWDLTGWVRSGIRPAPLFSYDLDAADERPAGRFVTLTRRFAAEDAVGVELNRQAGSWLLRGEASVTDSRDVDLGRAWFYTAQAEHAYRSGMITFIYASRGPDTAFGDTTPFDRAALPSVTIAMTQSEEWGDWHASWLGTLEDAGGLFDAGLSRALKYDWRLLLGVTAPHGSSISPVGAFSEVRRLRASLQYKW